MVLALDLRHQMYTVDGGDATKEEGAGNSRFSDHTIVT